MVSSDQVAVDFLSELDAGSAISLPKIIKADKANVVEINNPKQLLELFDAIEKNGKPYKYLIVDTITKWDEWSEIVGTLDYQKKSQGKKCKAAD